jgi:hypothetical protein
MSGDEKIIWSYWHDHTNIPYIVTLAILTWKKHNSDYTINFLTQNNFTKFVSVDELPPIFNSTTHLQEKADIIRLYVLYKYGGIWIDSSILITQPLAHVWDNQYDVGGYWIPIFTNNSDKKVFENWFISAPKESNLILAWKNEFYRALTDYKTRSDYISYIESIGTDLQKIDDKKYLMMHCCFLKVINEHNYNIKQFSATDNNGPLQWVAQCNWDPYSGSVRLCSENDDEMPHVIKFRGCDRKHITKLIENNKYSPDSVIDKIISSFIYFNKTYNCIVRYKMKI